ncbi:MAG: DUF4143 domain-containing protein [Gemmatimonadales bacterium]|nr:DUF4143 domain-containing protein [Gemmatimonadales bacterium]
MTKCRLYPPSWAELQQFPDAPRDLLEVLWSGAYPRIYDRGIPPSQWLADYLATYVQRDVRQLLNVTDLQAFTAFLRLCAGATASEVHLSRLGADAGVSHNTARAWLSVLEASHLVFRLPAWHPNLRKRVVRSSKLHFVDTGLVCHLLGIRAPEELRTHPLRGAVFETWVAAEVMKRGRHEGLTTELFHYRDSAGLEVDLVVGAVRSVILAEAKSGATIASDYPDSVRRLTAAIERRDPQIRVASRVVYGGDERQTRGSTEIIPWRDVAKVSWQPAPAGGPSSSTT